jgi:hypothetical protein
MIEPFRLETHTCALASAKSFRTLLGVSECSFRWLVDSGRLPEPTRIGARVFWPPDIVTYHVARCRRRYRR